MSDVPVERSTVTPLFTYVGLDPFGPFSVKEGRKELTYGTVWYLLVCTAEWLT